MANKNSSNPWKKATIILIIVAVVLQAFSYYRFTQLKNINQAFINSIYHAKIEQEVFNALRNFVDANKPTIETSKSSAFLKDKFLGLYNNLKDALKKGGLGDVIDKAIPQKNQGRVDESSGFYDDL